MKRLRKQASTSSEYKRKGIIGRRVFSKELAGRIDHAVPQVARMAGVSKNMARNVLNVIFAADAYMQMDDISKKGLSQMMVCQDCLDPHVGFPEGAKCVNCGGTLVRRPGFAATEIEITQNVEPGTGGEVAGQEAEATGDDIAVQHHP